jgi:predicted enzyme related to lactoylglutathione lyase
MSAQVTHFEIDADEPRRLPRFYKALVGRDVVEASDADCFHIHLTPAQTELRGGVRLRPLRAVVRLGGHVIRGRTALPGKAWSALVQDPEKNVFVVHELDPAAAADAYTEEALAFER